MKRTIWTALLAGALLLASGFGLRARAQDALSVLALDYEALPTAYAGLWQLTGAYDADAGLLPVAEGACEVEMRAVLAQDVLVRTEKYVHADVYELEGVMRFGEAVEGAGEYACASSWDGFTTVNVYGEDRCEVYGANMIVISGISVDMYFEQVTGVLPDDLRRIRYVGLNGAGQLVIGCSDGHIERDPNAGWLYAYVFTRVEEEP